MPDFIAQATFSTPSSHLYSLEASGTPIPWHILDAYEIDKTSLLVEPLEDMCQRVYRVPIKPFNDEKKPTRNNIKLPNAGRRLSPYNGPCASGQWLAILKSSPRYWNRIIIDLAGDPAPLLDAFSISQSNIRSDRHLDVIIFSSLKNRLYDEDTWTATGVEYRRANTIFEKLAPHIPRCRRTISDPVYEPSPPFAAVVLYAQTGALRALCLTCEIKNNDLGSRRVTLNHPGDRWSSQHSSLFSADFIHDAFWVHGALPFTWWPYQTSP